MHIRYINKIPNTNKLEDTLSVVTTTSTAGVRCVEVEKTDGNNRMRRVGCDGFEVWTETGISRAG